MVSLDNKTLEQRLVTKDTVIGHPTSLAKCAQKLAALRSFTTPEGSKLALEAFVREMILYRLDLNKSCRLLKSSNDQLEEYDQLENQVKDRISQTRDEIQRLTIELKQEQEIRALRTEIESIASQVNKHSSISSLKRRISEITENVESTRDAIASVENEIMVRKSQLDQLENILAILESKLAKDTDPAVEENEVENDEWNNREVSGKDDVKSSNENYADPSGGGVDDSYPAVTNESTAMEES